MHDATVKLQKRFNRTIPDICIMGFSCASSNVLFHKRWGAVRIAATFLDGCKESKTQFIRGS